MAGTKISELTDIDALSGGDFLPVSRGFSTLKISGNKIFPITEPRLNADSVSTRTIINGNVTLPKIQSISANTVLGRSGTSGSPDAIQVQTGMVANNAITYGKLQTIATANRVLGATTAGGTVSEVQVQTNMVADNAVTYGKIQTVATANRVLGSTTASGVVSEVQVQTDMIADTAVIQGKLAINSVGTNQIIGNNVTIAKIQQIAANSVLGNNTFATNNVAAVKITNDMVATGFGLIPTGGIIMWSGTISNIPATWALCDGTNGTPDLRNRFIVGAHSGAGTGTVQTVGPSINASTGTLNSNYTPGNIGGLNSVALTIAEMPSHTHTTSNVTVSQDGVHTHRLWSGTGDTGTSHGMGSAFGRNVAAVNDQTNSQYRLNLTGATPDRQAVENSPAHSHTVTVTLNSQGNDNFHENRPLYYALAFIMKL